MNVSKTRSIWLMLAAVPLASILLTLVGLGPRRGVVSAAQASAPAAQQTPANPSAEALHLLAGRSLVITSPARITRVSLADPAVVDALAVNPNQILITGKGPGAASLVIWDESGQSQTFDVFIDLDVGEMAARIHQVLPNEPIRVEASGGLVTLSGRVSSQVVADRVVAIAQAMVPRKDQVVSLLDVPIAPTTGEVLLEVKFADVDRSILRQFGTNLLSTSPSKNVVTTSTGQFSPPALQTGQTVGVGQTTTTTTAVSAAGVPVTLGQLLNIFYFRPDINFGAVIQALQEKNLLQILAEPNVLAETGKEASFLAGGQFPFPVVQGATGGVPVVTIQFREFGVKLVFTPMITPDGLVHLKVAPEVSSLDFTNALTIQGFTIPSVTSRRVESQMILRDGQSFVIAGLMNNQVTEQFSKIPGLGDIPILGQLFKSRSISKSQDELLVMVTPHIINVAATPAPPPPPQFPDSFLPPLPREKEKPKGAK